MLARGSMRGIDHVASKPPEDFSTAAVIMLAGMFTYFARLTSIVFCLWLCRPILAPAGHNSAGGSQAAVSFASRPGVMQRLLTAVRAAFPRKPSRASHTPWAGLRLG
jgi:hypothetical protein